MNLAILAVLITQTYGGQLSVVEGLSDHACAEAVCVAKEGMICDEVKGQADFAAKVQKERREEWVAAHPKQAAKCKAIPLGSFSTDDCGPQGLYLSPLSYSRIVNPDEIKIARCVK